MLGVALGPSFVFMVVGILRDWDELGFVRRGRGWGRGGCVWCVSVSLEVEMEMLLVRAILIVWVLEIGLGLLVYGCLGRWGRGGWVEG